MNRLTLPASRVPVLRRLSRPLPGTGPEAFLAAFQGAPRGFWGRNDRWVAWGGAIQELRVDPSGEEGMGRAVERARDTLAHLRSLRAPGDPAPRLFGGFAFIPGGGSADGSGAGSEAVWRDREPIWEGFPTARFILPEFLLEGEGPRARLVLHWLDGERAEPGPGGTESPPAGARGRSGAAGSERSALHRLQGLARRVQATGGGGPLPSMNGSPVTNRPRGATEDGSRVAGGLPAPLPRTGSLQGSGVDRGGAGDGCGAARAAWTAAVDEVLSRIRRGELEKAVLARILDVDLPRPARPERVLARLRAENPRAHVFLFEPDPGRILLGAAPEILAELRAGRFHATAVAGSISRGSDHDADAELAARLLASGKDLAEHRHTVEVMREALAPLVPELEVDGRPRVLTLARIQHLETGFRGRPAPGVDILALLQALHPTPAVCGRPRERALELIRKCEPFHRGWYAGPLGWVDTAGEGDFVPALRSAVGEGARWRLFAGAGIVEGSDPALEWEETGLKFEPVLRALGAERP
jgi:isochorismate synthase